MKKFVNPRTALGLKSVKYKNLDWTPPTIEERTIKKQEQLEKFIDDQLEQLGKIQN